MKYILALPFSLIILLYNSISIAQTNNQDTKLDPDSLSPTMAHVIYHIEPKELSIASYRQGEPSHFKLLLCRQCQEKIYPLSPEAKIIFDNKSITRSELALIVLKKEFFKISVTINQATGSIDYLDFRNASKYDPNSSFIALTFLPVKSTKGA